MSSSNSSIEPEIPAWLGERKWVSDRIYTETGRVGVAAYAVINELRDLHPSLQPVLLRWWQHGEIDMELSVEGWSIRRLVEETVVQYPTIAITWLSHLLTEPEKHLKMLSKPFHYVVNPNLSEKTKDPVH